MTKHRSRSVSLLSVSLSLILVSVVALLAPARLLAQDPAKGFEHTQRLLAYYPDWAKYQTPAYNAEKIPYHKVTHILEAFLFLKAAKGNLYIEPGLLEPALNRKAYAAGVSVMISIGGADPVQANRFSKVAASDTARRAFAANVHTFLDEYAYDGVDIDWEVPNAPKDTQPCIQLMEALRDELPAPQYLISMAVPSDPPSYGTGFDIPALAPLVDFLNVMTYDFHGPWSDHAGHNSPLFVSPEDPEQEGSVKTSMDLYEKQYGVERSKLNMGTAFYGYEFDGESSLWEYCPNQNCSNTSSQNYGTYIKQHVNQMGWKRHYDPIARAPYLLQEDPTATPGFMTYDDARLDRSQGALRPREPQVRRNFHLGCKRRLRWPDPGLTRGPLRCVAQEALIGGPRRLPAQAFCTAFQCLCMRTSDPPRANVTSSM